MAVMKRRSRMINFRLSEAEYEQLRTFCVLHGERSLSDFARTAVYEVMNGRNGGPVNGVETTVEKLSGRVEEIEGELKRLAQLLESAALRGRRSRSQEAD